MSYHRVLRGEERKDGRARWSSSLLMTYILRDHRGYKTNTHPLLFESSYQGQLQGLELLQSRRLLFHRCLERRQSFSQIPQLQGQRSAVQPLHRQHHHKDG